MKNSLKTNITRKTKPEGRELETIYFTKEHAMATRAAHDIIAKAKELAKKQKTIVIGVCGGNSTKGIYKLFSKSNDKVWKKIHIFFVDERVVPQDHDDSNYKMVKKMFIDTLVRKKILPIENVHPVIEQKGITKLANPKKITTDYYTLLKKYGGKFDIIILSSGEDGHVGSCFPKHKTLKDTKFTNITNSPKPPKQRITATLNLIQKSKFGVLLFVGKTKKSAYEQFVNNKITIENCPAKIITRMPEKIILVS